MTHNEVFWYSAKLLLVLEFDFVLGLEDFNAKDL